jgi:hypothetical protein
MQDDPDRTQELPTCAPDHRDNWTPPKTTDTKRRYAKTASPLTVPRDLDAEPLRLRNDSAEDARVERFFALGMAFFALACLALLVAKSDLVGV